MFMGYGREKGGGVKGALFFCVIRHRNINTRIDFDLLLAFLSLSSSAKTAKTAYSTS
jgi:hypothetical protein